jgi:cytochrome bd-type quinol oxidase subunit 2
MKKMTDERLKRRNLEHVRIVYIVQTLGILCILAYDFMQGGMEAMRENPLWLVFIGTSVVFAYLSMSVSVEHERQGRDPKKQFIVSIAVILGGAAVISYLISITPDYGWGDGLLLGVIIAVCGGLPVFYIYRLRLKQADLYDEEDE